MLFKELHKRAKKVGQPPGTAIYTGRKKATETHVTVLTYSEQNFDETEGKNLEEILPTTETPGVTWIHVEGLQNIALIEQLAKIYHIHPLTVEDILNVDQRPKVEEFPGYLFITLKMLTWHEKKRTFSTEQISFVVGKNFLLSFQERPNNIYFKSIRERLKSHTNQRMRQQGSDYLVYRLMDAIVDYYFVVLEGLGDQIEKIEDIIITDPKPQNTRTIYRLKRQLMLLRKSIWPMREAISHLMQVGEIFTSFTRIYLRDLYDHVVQAIDTVETCRDILASMLDVYLSSLTNRMNEIMKTLTIIATIFIPITFIASFYGMNFQYMPELHWRHGYAMVIGIMLAMVVAMLIYFKRKKWI